MSKPNHIGRTRVPTKVLELRNAFKKHPERRKDRENEPVVTIPIGDPPKTFDEAQLQAWTDITRTAPAGVLTAADRLAVENAARLLARERAGTNSDSGGRRLDQLLGKFGMTPSDRSKVSVSIPTRTPTNPFEAIN